MIYWDTSCLLKLYVTESDSLLWQERAVTNGESLLTSNLSVAELGFALAHKEAQGGLKKGGATKLCAQFKRDVEKGRFKLVPIESHILDRAVLLAVECLQASPAIHLRTLDGIYLSTAVLMRCSSLATADERMSRAARVMGLGLL